MMDLMFIQLMSGNRAPDKPSLYPRTWVQTRTRSMNSAMAFLLVASESRWIIFRTSVRLATTVSVRISTRLRPSKLPQSPCTSQKTSLTIR